MYTYAQIKPLLVAAELVLSHADNTGCQGDLTVTSEFAVNELQKAFGAIPAVPPTLAIGMHTHDQGVSLYPFLVPAGRPFDGDEFANWLGDTFEEDREENAEVQSFTEREFITLGQEDLPEGGEGSHSREDPGVLYIGKPVGRILLPNGRVVPIDANDEIEATVQATVYELVEQGLDEVDGFLSKLVTGTDEALIDQLSYHVEGRTASGELIICVHGILDRAALPEGFSSEPLCRKCGSELGNDGYCPDVTCVYSDWPQPVSLDDVHCLTRSELEAKYDILKRDRAPD